MNASSSSHQTPEDFTRQAPLREVNYEYSRDFLPILQHLQVSLLVSTYQAGKVACIGCCESELLLSLHNFEKAMGIAISPGRIAVGAKGIVWLLEEHSQLARQVEPVGKHDRLYLTKKAFVTGNIHGHEMAWSGDQLWVVNTLFSCLCTLNEEFSFVPQWQPPFITELAGEDRCHLNGFCLIDGKPQYVTVMAQSNEPAGWRPTKATSGCVMHVESGQVVAHGLSMPHSPRVFDNRLWVLDSGKGQLCVVDPITQHVESVATVPGYTRGLAFCGQFAFVGMSKIRETSVFGGLPIAQKQDELRCGVAVIDLVSGTPAAFIQFNSGVDEIFDVQVLSNSKTPTLRGPYPDLDASGAVWVVPPSGHPVPAFLDRKNPFRRS